MNNPFKKFILTVAACLTVVIVSAQERTAASEQVCRERAQQTVSDLKLKLNLTNEQQKAVFDIMNYAEMKRANKSGADSQIDIYVREEMNKVLTPSQMNVWMRAEAAKINKTDPETPKPTEHQE